MDDQSIQQFFEACRAARPLQLQTTSPGQELPTQLRLDRPFAVIGRKSRLDVVLKHTQIGRRHAYFQLIGGRLFCVDLQSRTGVHWADKRFETGWVESGQAVRIGPFSVQFQVPALTNENAGESTEAWDPLASIPVESDPLPAVTLDFVLPEARGDTSWHMNRTLALVGSSTACKVQLAHRSVSRFHASLLRTPLGVWVVDLFGRGGVSVNGRRVRFSCISDGDEVQVGAIRIRLSVAPRSNRADDRDDRPQSQPADCDVVQLAESPTPRIHVEENSVDAPAPIPDTVACEAIEPTSRDHLPAPLSPSRTELQLFTPVGLPATSDLKSGEPVLDSLVYHFGRMQEQMADQFQQAVMTLVQMFSAFHRDQMELIRDEFDRLNELNKELRDVQAQLATIQLRNAEANARPESSSRSSSTARRKTSHRAVHPAKAHNDVVSKSPPLDGNGRMPPSVVNRKQPAPSTARQSEPSGEEIHAWLCQRMMQIQEEQQSLWQRILNTVRTTVPRASV